MPIIEMHLVEGRTSEQKRDMARAVTNALNDLGVKRESIRIFITEHKNEEFYAGGITIEERRAAQAQQKDQEG